MNKTSQDSLKMSVISLDKSSRYYLHNLELRIFIT